MEQESQLKTQFCNHCGAKVPMDIAFCGECGKPLKTADKNKSTTNKTTKNMDAVKKFYKERFPQIFKSVFTKPIQGTHELFSTTSKKNYQQAMVLIISTGLLFIFLPYIAVGGARDYIKFSNFLMLGAAATLCLLIISIFSFFIKSISGKADFKNELLTGGICGVPLSFLMVILFLLSFVTDNLMQSIVNNPQHLLDNGLMLMLIVFYCLLSLINILQQSLKSAGTNDAMSWYLSPLSILLSFYLSGKIILGLMDGLK